MPGRSASTRKEGENVRRLFKVGCLSALGLY